MSNIESIKVVVRVRPFNARELASNAICIIEMDGKQTSIVDPQSSEPRKFYFDHSYWSHDGYKERPDGYNEPAIAKYIDQERVFQDLGIGMLENAWKGYNCTIFAYGQTGSGKSYSIMGYGANKGVVPKLCEELFKQIDSKSLVAPDRNYQVQFSMLEIYNEQVRDLLAKKTATKFHEGLKIRQSPTEGFYVQDLSSVAVGSYRDIELRIDEGNRNKTIAATNMNDRSSRAHTIVTLKFAQVDMKTKRTTTAVINLVDLAGSERANQTGATGQRLEESKKINQSLSELGNIIKGLCDKASGKKAELNFRNSKLTMLLKNALGGNSKTIMIAAISPAKENYDQTLSTLRYADRAKSIQTQAKINESETDKLIRELIAEKERLLLELKNKSGHSGYSDEDIERMKREREEEIRRYNEQLKDQNKIQQAWKIKLATAEKEIKKLIDAETQGERQKKITPYFWNLNEDPSLSGKIIHFIKAGKHKIGNRKAIPRPPIVLHGPSIAAEHAIVENRKGTVLLTAERGTKVLINGDEINDELQLKHNDRVLFGNTNLFVFHHPKEQERLTKLGQKLQTVTWEFAHDEILGHSQTEFDEDDALLREHVMELIPLVDDANEMAKIFRRNLHYKIILLPSVMRAQSDGQMEINIVVHNLDNENEYLWSRNTFIDKRCDMLSLYENYEDHDELPEISKDDPFWEKAGTPSLVGVVTIPLTNLAYGEEYHDNMLIRDYMGNGAGHLKVSLVPCDNKDKEKIDEDVYEPEDLVGKEIFFKVKLLGATDIPDRFVKTFCQYQLYYKPDVIKTRIVKGQNPNFTHEKVFHFKGEEANHQFVLEYLKMSSLFIEVYGYQFEDKNQRKTTVSRMREYSCKESMTADDIEKLLQEGFKNGQLIKMADVIKDDFKDEESKIFTLKQLIFSNDFPEDQPPRSQACSIQ